MNTSALHSPYFTSSTSSNILSQGVLMTSRLIDGATDVNAPASINEKTMFNKLDKMLKESNTHIKVSMHDKTHTILVKIIDGKTDEVIREIPPEKMLDVMYNLCSNMGIFIDTKM